MFVSKRPVSDEHLSSLHGMPEFNTTSEIVFGQPHDGLARADHPELRKLVIAPGSLVQRNFLKRAPGRHQKLQQRIALWRRHLSRLQTVPRGHDAL